MTNKFLSIRTCILLMLLWMTASTQAQTLLIPDRVFDGEEMHSGWVVVVAENKIVYAGPENGLKRANSYKKIDLEGTCGKTIKSTVPSAKGKASTSQARSEGERIVPERPTSILYCTRVEAIISVG